MLRHTFGIRARLGLGACLHPTLFPPFAALAPRPYLLGSRYLSSTPGPQPSSAPSAAPAGTLAWLSSMSPGALFAKVKALGPTALAFYSALWVGPFLLAYVPIAMNLYVAPDPLVLVDYWLPMVGDGLRSTLQYLQIELPRKGEPMPTYLSGIVWGFLFNDVLEPFRIFAVLALTPRINAYLKGEKPQA